MRRRPPECSFTGHAFTDGALRGRAPQAARRGGWACVLVDAEGKIIFGLYGPCPGDFPTALRAELRAVVVLLKHALPPLTTHVDCQTVVDGWTKGREWCEASCRPDADLWRELWRLLEDVGPGVVMMKCKGHATEADVSSGRATNFEKVANDNADHYAGAGATIAEQQRPNDGLITGYKDARRWYHWLATLAADLPRDTQEVVATPDQEAKAPRRANGLHDSQPHSPEKSSDRWTCTVCQLHVSVTASGKCRSTFFRSACRGNVADRAAANAATGKRHQLYVSGEITWCMTCGRYSSKRTNGLATQACDGYPKKGSAGPLGRPKAGVHPKRPDEALPRATRLQPSRLCRPLPG